MNEDETNNTIFHHRNFTKYNGDMNNENTVSVVIKLPYLIRSTVVMQTHISPYSIAEHS